MQNKEWEDETPSHMCRVLMEDDNVLQTFETKEQTF